MSNSKSNGFGLAGLIIAAVFMALIVFAGLRVNDQMSSEDQNKTNESQSTTSIKDSKDISTAINELDNVDLDQELNTKELQEDVETVI